MPRYISSSYMNEYHKEPTIYIDDSGSVGSNGTVSTSTFQSDVDIDDETTYLNATTDRKHPGYLSVSNEESYLCRPTSRCTTASPSPISSAKIDMRGPESTWNLLKTRSRYYIPILQWLPEYSKDKLKQDISSGLSISALFIPQALSYATGLCRLPAIHGLYTVTISTIVYACLGMSPQLSVGPEATVSLIVGSGIARQKIPLDPAAAASIAALTAFFVGLFTLALGIFRLGFLDSLMSRALLRGFITAVAVVVMIQQTIFLLGLDVAAEHAGITPESTTIQRIAFIATHLHETRLVTAALSACVLTVLFGVSFLKRCVPAVRRVPEVLLVVIASTLVCRIFHLDQRGVNVLGKVGSSDINPPLPVPSLPSLPAGADIKNILVNAAIISIIGFVESLAAGKTFARKHNYFVSANRELVALGTANIIGSFFQTFPAFGSFPRSKVHEAVGPKTQMSGLISGLTTILVTGLLLPHLYYLPSATLSGVIFMAVFALLQELPHDLEFMLRVRAWKDVLLLATTFTATMVFSLEVGTAIAVVFSLMITIKQSSYPRITIMGRVKETLYKFSPIKSSREKVEHLEDVLIVRVEEPLYFANTGQLKDRLRRLEHYGDLSVHPSEAPRRNDRLRYVIFDLGGMEFIDASAVQILYETIESYHARGVNVFLVQVHPSALPLLLRAGILDLIGSRQVCDEVADAIQAVEYDMTCSSVVVHRPPSSN